MKDRQIIGANSLPHWEITGHVELVSSGPQPGGFNFSVPRGVHAVRLGSLASISQNVDVTRDLVYSLTFGVTRSCAQAENILVSVPGKANALPVKTLFSSDGGDTYAWAFRGMSNTSVKVTFLNPGVQMDPTCGPLLMAVAIKELRPFPPPDIKHILKNGGFENGPHILANFSNGVLIPSTIQDIISPLPGWIIESVKPVKYIDNRHFKIPRGLAAVELLAGVKITQAIHTLPTVHYGLSFTVGDAQNGCHGSMMVQATVGKSKFKLAFESRGKGGFKTGRFWLGTVQRHTLVSFSSVYKHTKLKDSGHLCGPVLDNIDVRLYR